MFKKIQNHLLLRYPLLWNLKIVPLLACLLILHIVFFVLGYISGKIDFTHTGFDYFSYNDDSPLVIFFSVFLSLLFFILWMVYYFRNNAYKSFYPLSNSSLYKEWLIILLVCVLNCSYSVSYFYAKDLRGRNYFTEHEMATRLDILSMASVFVEGSFEEVDSTNANGIRITLPSVTFKGKDYSVQSLMNKSLKGFTYQTHEKDSLNKLRVRSWLAENRKDSILWLMGEFQKIAHEHNLKSNITPEKWFSLVYNNPDYTSFATIGEIESYPLNKGYAYEYSANYDAHTQRQAIDTKWFEIKTIKGVEYVFAKYYVPMLQLNNAYGNRISESWASPMIDAGTNLIALFFAFALAMAVFSFRVTSGKSWLIAFVALGVTSMLTGIFNIVMSGDEAYFLVWLFIILILLIWFIIIYTHKTNKGISSVILNNLLWLGMWVIPMLYLIALSSWRDHYTETQEPHPIKEWIKDNSILIMYCNFAFILIYMYFFTRTIKRWKGIAES